MKNNKNNKNKWKCPHCGSAEGVIFDKFDDDGDDERLIARCAICGNDY